jgi:hypothetical protein
VFCYFAMDGVVLPMHRMHFWTPLSLPMYNFLPFVCHFRGTGRLRT